MSVKHHLLKVFSVIVILAMTFSSLSPAIVQAQGSGGDGVKREINAETGKVNFISPESGSVLSARQALGTLFAPQDPAMALAQRFGPEFGLRNPAQELSAQKSSRAEDGRLTVHYQQNYQGIPVMGGELIVNTNDRGDLYSMNGEASPNLDLSTQPVISAEQAKETALQALAKWNEKSPEDFVATEPELWVYDEGLLQPSTKPAELVWRMDVTAKDNSMPLRELVLVNAQRGGISLHFNQIDTAWSGNQQADNAPTETPEPLPTDPPIPTDVPVIESTPTPELQESQPTVEAAVIESQIGPLAASTWYVATTGNDSNSCLSTDSPCQTINAAISKAAAGDMIKVAQGTYTGTYSYVVTIGDSKTLSGGWNDQFTEQNGFSVIDGENERSGVLSLGSTLDHVVITNGYAKYDSGGLKAQGPFLILNNSRVVNNRTDDESDSAGGINASSTEITLNNSVVRGNVSRSHGGGILVHFNYKLVLNNTTVTENHATGSGGGIFVKGNSNYQPAIYISNSTIASNSAKNGGGIYLEGYPYNQAVHLKNSILAKNIATVSAKDCWGTIKTFDHSLIGDTANCIVPAGSGNKTNVDPKLSTYPIGALPYYTLLAGSPAIDAGSDCLSTDQRGLLRPQGSACDMGAYEGNAAGEAQTFGISAGSQQRTPPGFAFSRTLAIYVTDGVGSPVPGVSVSFAAPASGASGTFADTGSNNTSVVTDESGLAISPIFTANTQPGSYLVSASASGLPGVANFVLTNAAWYVSLVGNDANSCNTPEFPCLNINAAIAKAVEGDLIKVAVGTYTGNSSPVVDLTKGVTLSGGWDESFVAQNGMSTVDGVGNTRMGIHITLDYPTDTSVFIDHFVIQNGTYGVFNANANVTLSYTSISNNHRGGYYYDYASGIDNRGNLTIHNSLITGNSLNKVGGGIENQGTLTVNNTTISGNNGSGIFNDVTGLAHPTVIINNSTITKNSLNGISTYTSQPESQTVFIQNSIVAGNTGYDCSGSITSTGFNLIGRDTGCIVRLAPGDQVGTTARPIDPKLYPLQNNGGPTLTHALLLNSPAINGGNPATPGSNQFACLTTDQRGANRPDTFRCDIGAYEGSQWSSFTPLVNTYTANQTSSLPGTLLCNQTQPNCTNNANPHADAAHRYAIGTYNFYASQYNRNSIDNNKMVIKSTVHYCKANLPCPYENAYWSGTQMVYGDKYGFPLADDVVAHELTHGVTQYESDLFYYYQSGAINESLADLWGEYYDQSNGQGNDAASVKWLLGENVSGLGALRSMSNPPAFGDPDKMSSTYYYEGQNDNGGVHINSGVNNKAVYLMVSGGTFNGITVSALGWNKTAAIYYEANTRILTSGSDYSDLYYGLQRACINLIGQKGITSGDCLEVRDAANAVEMNGQPAPKFNADAPVCGAGQMPKTVFFDDLENGNSSLSWQWYSTLRWQIDSPYGSFAHSGNHFLYADDYPAQATVASILLNNQIIPSNAYLTFYHAYDFESYIPAPGPAYFDGGVLEYTSDNGQTWRDAGSLIDYNKYTGVIYPNWNNPLKGRSAFVGASHGYISTRLNLSSLAGKNVQFRWSMGMDDTGYRWGWWLDDVHIYTCVVMPAITGNAGVPNVTLNYTDGFYKRVLSQTNGQYSVPVPTNWSGTITPSHPCYTFEPTSRTYDGITENRIGQDFTATFNNAPECGETVGVFRPSNGVIFLKNSNTSGFADVNINYGLAGDYPVVGDWDGNGSDTIGVYRNGSFLLRNSNSKGFADLNFAFGQPGDQPIAGDWDGDGDDTIGIFRPSTAEFWLRNDNSAGDPDVVFKLGNPGDVGIAGDWDGDGIDTTGVFRPSNGIIFLKNKNESGYADIALNYGLPGDKPVVGDWDNNGTTTIGVFRNARFLLRNSNTKGFADIQLDLGLPTDLPIAGNWDGLP